jgi:hypothetical protein
MRASASVVRADNPRLEREPMKKIEAAMQEIEKTGLVQTFTHQGVKFWWQRDWNDFQNVRYPRDTVNPAPSQELIAASTDKQQKLFSLRGVAFRKSSGNDSEVSPHPARTGRRETLALTLTAPSSDLRQEDWRDDLRDVEADVEPVSATPTSWNTGQRHKRESALMPVHPKCDPATFTACRRGFCVPFVFAGRWRTQVDPDSRDRAATDAYIRAVVERGVAKLPSEGALGVSALQFWDDHWKAEHAGRGPAATVTDRASRTLAAGRELIQQQIAARQGKVS